MKLPKNRQVGSHKFNQLKFEKEQSNKIKHIIDKVGMIESVSSINLAKAIQKIALNIENKIPVLICIMPN